MIVKLKLLFIFIIGIFSECEGVLWLKIWFGVWFNVGCYCYYK